MFVAGQKGLPARLRWPCTSSSSQLPAITSTPPAACADRPARRGLIFGRRGWQGRLQAWEQAPGCAKLTADVCCPQERGANSAPGMEERSYYIDYIYKDLEPWKENGITEVRGCRVEWLFSHTVLALERAWSMEGDRHHRRVCLSSAFRKHGHHVCRLPHRRTASCTQLRGSPRRRCCTLHLGAVLPCVSGRAACQALRNAGSPGGACPRKPAAQLQQPVVGATYVWV